jgi:hypothetical protein
MAHIVINPSKKKKTRLIFVLGVTNMQQRMLNGGFEGYILRYWLYDVVGNGYKFIHCDFTDKGGFLTITLTVRAAFVTIGKYRITNLTF